MKSFSRTSVIIIRPWRTHKIQLKLLHFLVKDFLNLCLLCLLHYSKALGQINSCLKWMSVIWKNSLKQTWKSFNTKFLPQWKDQKNSYQVRQVLALFSTWIALIAKQLPKLSKKLILKEFGASKKQKAVSRDNHLQNIWD